VWLSVVGAFWADHRGQHDNTTRGTDSYDALLAFRSSDGYSWDYAGTVATHAQLPTAEEGPSESALAQTRDGRVCCIFRTDGGDGRPSHLHSPYAITFSSDGGRSWTIPKMLPAGVGCARPELLSLGGALVLSGGRPSAASQDPMIWIDRTGMGMSWQPRSLSYTHNQFLVATARNLTNGSTPLPWWHGVPGALAPGNDRPGWSPRIATIATAKAACEADADCVGFTYQGARTLPANATPSIRLKSRAGSASADPSWTTFYKPCAIQPFDKLVNTSSFPHQSTAYTSLRRTSERSAVIVYDQWRHHMGNVWRVYAMQIHV
jgi:hypothetical protein